MSGSTVGVMMASVGSMAGAELKWASGVVLLSASFSAAMIRRRRRIGDSIVVLTIHSCSAVRLSIRERCSTKTFFAPTAYIDQT